MIHRVPFTRRVVLIVQTILQYLMGSYFRRNMFHWCRYCIYFGWVWLNIPDSLLKKGLLWENKTKFHIFEVTSSSRRVFVLIFYLRFAGKKVFHVFMVVLSFFTVFVLLFFIIIVFTSSLIFITRELGIREKLGRITYGIYNKFNILCHHGSC